MKASVWLLSLSVVLGLARILHAQVSQVSAPGDGTMVALDKQAHSYWWNAGRWQKISDQPMSEVAAGSAKEVWGVDPTGNVFQLGTHGWDKRPGTLKYISVTKGGGMVLGINTNGQVVRWDPPNWTPVTNAPAGLQQIKLGGQGSIYGITASGELYSWTGRAGDAWVKRAAPPLKSLTVGVDGSVGGITTSGNAVVSKNPSPPPQDAKTSIAGNNGWQSLNVPIKDFELVTGKISVIMDPKDQIAQINNIQLTISGSQLTIQKGGGIYDPPLLTSPKQTIDPNQCVPIGSASQVTVAPNQVQTTAQPNMIDYTCVAGKFSKVAIAVPQPSQQGAGPSQLLTTTDVATDSSSSGGNSYAYVAQASGAPAGTGPTVCGARIFRDVSNHSWVDFKMPAGSEGQTISVPAGAYNHYVLPACNRVYWSDLQFTCHQSSGWTLTQGKYDADAACTGSPGSSPYVSWGDR